MSNPKTKVNIFKTLRDFDEEVEKYTKSTPKIRKTRISKDKQLEEIEKGMIDLKEAIRKEPDSVALRGYNDLIDKLDRYEGSDKFKKAYEGKIVPRHKLEKFKSTKVEEQEEQKEEMKEEETPDTQEFEVSELEEDPSQPGSKLVDDDEGSSGSDTTMGGDTPRPASAKQDETRPGSKPASAKQDETRPGSKPASAKQDETRPGSKPASAKQDETRPGSTPASAKQDETRPGSIPIPPMREDEEEDISPEMEEFHNQIRRDERERVIAEFNITEDTEGKIDIPKERLGTEGKSIKVLNEDIKYFLKRFPDMLKLERDVYNKANKKDKKLLIDIHRRIQAKLSPKANETTKKIGIILDADSYIDDKINEILARKTLEGLTPANLVDITSEPKSKGKDVGSYTLTQVGGRDVVQNAPVYRAIPSTSDEALAKDMKDPPNAQIDQSTIYKNSGKTKVDIAKMELVDNPFIRRTRPDRFNIIL